MFFEPYRQRPRSVRSAWVRAVYTGEKLYLIGVGCVLVHVLVEILMVVGAVGKLYPVPSWVWIELALLVCVLAPIVWFRLLCVVSTHTLRLAQQEHYLCVALASAGAFVAALQPSTSWWTYVAFPLMSITYLFHFGLDARLPVRQLRRPPTRRRAQHGRSSARRSSGLFDCAPAAHLVSVWCSLDDSQWAQEFCKHLRPYVHQRLITLQQCIARPGIHRPGESAQVIESSAVVVVFVSAQMISNEGFMRHDVQEIVQRCAHGTRVLVFYISACTLHGSGLELLQAVNSLERPLAKLRKADRAAVFYQTASLIHDHFCL